MGTIGDFVIVQERSKIKAGEGLANGKYKFFTSSNIQSKWLNEFQYDKPALIFGTGGMPSVHYCATPFSTSTDCVVMCAKGNANIEVIYHYLAANMHLLEAGFRGVGLQHISKRFILDIEIPRLSEGVQTKVVSICNCVNCLISLRKQQLAKLDEAVKSRFIELFGDPVSNLKGWEIAPLGKRCEIVTGNTPSRAESENYGEFIEWIKSDNINTPFTFITKAQECLSEAGFKKCRFVEAGSLLMTCIAGSINCIGNVAVADRRVAFNQQINAIVPERDEVLYLYWLMLLSKPVIHSTINMALKGILSKGQLAELTFPFPPIMLQKRFAIFVEQTDKSSLTIQQSLDKLETLKNSLMQQYFG